MKRYVKIILVTILISILVILVLKPRSDKRMKAIAVNVLENHLGKGYDTTSYNVVGPIVTNKDTASTTFQWYKLLPWGDTASIYVDVSRKLNSLTWRNDYFFPSITMNYHWNYLLGALSDFNDILPEEYSGRLMLKDQPSLYENHSQVFQESELTLLPSRVFYYLKQGYFRMLEKNEDYSAVEFYEPIGTVTYRNNDKIETSFTLGAKVFVNENFEVMIVPYKINE